MVSIGFGVQTEERPHISREVKRSHTLKGLKGLNHALECNHFLSGVLVVYFRTRRGKCDKIVGPTSKSFVEIRKCRSRMDLSG